MKTCTACECWRSIVFRGFREIVDALYSPAVQCLDVAPGVWRRLFLQKLLLAAWVPHELYVTEDNVAVHHGLPKCWGTLTSFSTNWLDFPAASWCNEYECYCTMSQSKQEFLIGAFSVKPSSCGQSWSNGQPLLSAHKKLIRSGSLEKVLLPPVWQYVCTVHSKMSDKQKCNYEDLF